MKKFQFLLTAVLVLGFTLLATTACKDDSYSRWFKKERKKKEPIKPKNDGCNTLVTTEGINTDNYHFLALEGNFSNKKLFADNYKDYAAKIQPNKKYKIGYELIPTITMDAQYDYTLIHITCLTEADYNTQCDCKNQSVINDVNFDLHSSNALAGAYIKDDKLYIKGQFISTDAQYAPDYTLLLKENFTSNVYPWHMLGKLDIKYLKRDSGLYTDLITLNKLYCIDLLPLKNQYNKTMQPGQIVLHLDIQLTDGKRELVKYHIN